jgi:hypothetical protein
MLFYTGYREICCTFLERRASENNPQEKSIPPQKSVPLLKSSPFTISPELCYIHLRLNLIKEIVKTLRSSFHRLNSHPAYESLIVDRLQ